MGILWKTSSCKNGFDCAFSLLSLTLFICLTNSCSTNEEDKQGHLFQHLSPRQTGIDFANVLHESDSNNSLFYEYYYNGAGLAVGDVNNDGLSDVFFGGNMEKSRLYLNKDHFKFEDITEQSGINTAGSWVTGVCMVDVNCDGWLDIYLCVGGNIIDDYRNLLYINNGNKDHLAFTEQAKNIGLDDTGYSTQAAFFDYDLDGDLDMYLVTSSMRVPNKNSIRKRTSDGSMINTDRLYRNEGIDNTTTLPIYRNVSEQAGITWDGFGLGICVSDINMDGWPDVYVANDYITNDLFYINQKDGTFKDMAQEYFKHLSYSAMGVDIADINNDGLSDVFTLDMLPEDYFRKRIMAGNMRNYSRYITEMETGYSPQYIRNCLQLNNGEIDGVWSFSEIGQLSGIFETDWSWAPLFADFDNDGHKDLFIGNGIPHDLTNMDFSAVWQSKMKENPNIEFSVLYEILAEDLRKKGNVKKPNFIFQNKGNLIYEDKTATWGMDKPSYSTGAAFSDLDNDGDLDLILNNINDPASIYQNTIADSLARYLAIKLQGAQNNPGGLGAKIKLFCNNEMQYYEHFPVRGFQSMVDNKIHFGLGNVTEIDSLLICWPDAKEQWLFNLEVDKLLELRYDDASAFERNKERKNEGNKLFKEISDDTQIKYNHKERVFIDFKIQPLIPHQFSKEGPGIAVADVNGDGLEDFFVGGSTSYQGAIYVQNQTGGFSLHHLPDNNNYEDMGALFFDADSDGDNDLYVVSGGTGLPPGNPYYTDRLYINDGKGNFIKEEIALPEGVCGSQVSAADFDRDGDLDLFVCGRVNLENYPLPPRSFLLRNDSKDPQNIHFTDITSTVSETLANAGLVSTALWSDYDQDGWTDLILAGEWMPITFYKNDKGILIDMTSTTGLTKYTGWWNSLVSADFDKDGDPDYVAGNLGLNTRFKVSQEQPMRIVAKDFESDGKIDPICSYYVQGENYPMYHRNLMINQMPFLRNKFVNYEDYARATMADIFTEAQYEDAYKADSRTFESAYIQNQGDGTFTMQALPIEAQFAPVYGMLVNDYNGDDNLDLLLTGNSYSFNVEDGRQDAFIGLFLEGDGEGNFSTVFARNSGFFVDGDAKGMAELLTADGHSLILAAQNSGVLKVFRAEQANGKIITLQPHDIYAEILYSNGQIERKEFYYGSGYLSQSSRSFRLTEGIRSIKIYNSKGESRDLSFD